MTHIPPLYLSSGYGLLPLQRFITNPIRILLPKKMDVLFRFRKDLEKRRHSVCDSEDSFFYIFEELRDIITDSIIIDLLSFNTSDHAAESVVKTIRQDGPRLFCILAIMGQVNQIKNFLAHDVLDNRLPIRDETELEEIAPSLGHHFFTKYQWEFFPFMFRKDRGHLILSQNITLPLTSNEELAEGSGGIVSIMKIPALTQDFYDLVRNMYWIVKLILPSAHCVKTNVSFINSS